MPRLPYLFTASYLLASCATSTTPQPEDPADQAQQHIDALVAAAEVPGLQYRVVDARGTIFAAAAGVRDVASGQAMEQATLLMVYSVTKVVTAIAVLQLVEGGKLALDEPLSRYHVAHPYGAGVTIRQLLAHTAGVPDPLPLDWFEVEGTSFDRDRALRDVLAAKPKLRQPPGQGYAYSNLSYWLLEEVVEAASGRDFAAYVEDAIFRPLALGPQHARFDLGPVADVAAGHSARFSPITLMLRMMTPGRYWLDSHGDWTRSARVLPHGRAYGGLFASATALGVILGDLLSESSTLLSASAKAAMLTQQHTRDGKLIAGTLGWVAGEVAGERYLGKPGGGLGFHGNVRIYPGRGLATVMLANRTEISAGPIDARSDALDAIFLQPKHDGRVALHRP